MITLFLLSTLEILGFVAIGVLSLIIIIVAIFVIRKFSKKKTDSTTLVDSDGYINALGGIDNILESKAVSSRLTVVLKDLNLLNKEALHDLNPISTVFMSSKIIIVCKEASNIDNYIKSKLQ